MDFRKKPIRVEARQWPTITTESPGITRQAEPFHEWVGKSFRDFWRRGDLWGRIETLEGVMEVTPGDWIIKGVNGEFYPCKPDIFAATYEPAVQPKPGAVCPTCERIQPPTVQDHDCDEACQEEEHRAIRCMLQIVPGPGEECPLCREKTPNKHALEVRAWRAKRKAEVRG